MIVDCAWARVCPDFFGAAENLARAFWQQLAPAIDQGSLYEIALQETEKNSVVYRGEDETTSS